MYSVNVMSLECGHRPCAGDSGHRWNCIRPVGKYGFSHPMKKVAEYCVVCCKFGGHECVYYL